MIEYKLPMDASQSSVKLFFFNSSKLPFTCHSCVSLAPSPYLYVSRVAPRTVSQYQYCCISLYFISRLLYCKHHSLDTAPGGTGGPGDVMLSGLTH